MEDTIERIVGYFRYASQGLEERKQILYLLGPVGGGKSSLAERLKKPDGAAAHLYAEGRRTRSARFLNRRSGLFIPTAWPICWKTNTASRGDA